MGAMVAQALKPKNLGITIDSAVTMNVSYSSLETLSTCPRKFELNKIHPIQAERDTSAAMSLGSAVGVGYARYLELINDPSLTTKQIDDDVLLETWRAYYPPLEDATRSISKAHVIVQALIAKPFLPNGMDDPLDWELAVFDGKPAVELSFCIQLTDNLVYVGYLDGVMYSPSTDKYRPLELKTTSLYDNLKVNFSNSAQGLAYGLILDSITASPQREFDVHYRVAQLHRTKAEAYRPTIHDFYFKKTLTDRLEWLIGLQMEVDRIGTYMKYNLFPKRGGACLTWGKPCQFYGICGLTNNPPLPQAKKTDYQFYFNLQDLIKEALDLVAEEVQ